ncbi:hypothetical protein IE989_01935 [Klebsiella pneumoniae]|nr:hypothetical protein [Klebsiella pneumoniae]
MSRKQLALLEPTLVRRGAAGCREKTQPDGAMAQSGDVYRLGGQSVNHPAGDRHGWRRPDR